MSQPAATAAFPSAPPPLSQLAASELDRLTALQEEALRAEVARQPLVGALAPAAALRAHFAGTPAIAAKLPAFEARFEAFRPVRGDGDCFPRAVLLRLGELYVEAGVRAAGGAAAAAAAAVGEAAPPVELPLQAHYAALVNRVAGAGDLLVNAFGYSAETVPDFMSDGLGAFLRLVGAPASAAAPQPYAALGGLDRMRSYSALFALRLLGSLEVRRREEEFLPFILGTTDCATAEDFCAATERSRGSTDVDQVQIMAVAAALQVRLQIAYLDAGAGAELNIVRIPEGEAEALLPPGAPTLHLLYRPGHFDVTYERGTLPAFQGNPTAAAAAAEVAEAAAEAALRAK